MNLHSGFIHLPIIFLIVIAGLVADIFFDLINLRRVGGLLSIYGILLGAYGINPDILKPISHKKGNSNSEAVDNFVEAVGEKYGLYKPEVKTLKLAVFTSIVGIFIGSFGDVISSFMK